MKERPLPGEVAEAASIPNGWVYRIAGSVADPNGRVPPEAIIGAWKVDAVGKITGEFIPNPKYDALKWPSRKSN
jgi:hypothetical protein